MSNDIKYLVYKYSDGPLKKEAVNIKLLDNRKYGTTGAYHVLVDDKDKAYLKTSKSKYVDDIDISISQFAKYFNIDVTDIYRLEDINGGLGILSYDIRNDDNKRYISLYDAYYNYYSKYKRGEISNLSWAVELLSLPNSSKDNPLKREDYIKIVIDMAINILKDQFNIDDSNIIKLKKQYLRILLFDYFTNQADRSLGNINLVMDDNDVSFAALYDNGCVYNKDIGDNNIFLLDHICDRDSFIRTIFKYYYSDIEDDLKVYLDDSGYIANIESILKSNLSDSNYNWYYKKIVNNIKRLKELYNEHEEELSEVKNNDLVDLSLQYGYVKTFSLLLSTLLVLLVIVILIQIFV